MSTNLSVSTKALKMKTKTQCIIKLTNSSPLIALVVSNDEVGTVNDFINNEEFGPLSFSMY